MEIHECYGVSVCSCHSPSQAALADSDDMIIDKELKANRERGLNAASTRIPPRLPDASSKWACFNLTV
jgi:hypothetical protein